MALPHQMLGKRETDDGGMKRGCLSVSGPFIGFMVGVMRLFSKGKTRLEFGMKDNGVVHVTQGFKTFDQGQNSGFISL